MGKAKRSFKSVGALAALLSGAALLSAGLTPAHAQAHVEEHKATLRAIMQDLGAEYGRLANALFVEDFKGLEESAKAIQGHPLPDELAAAIKSKLGKDFRRFERADEQTHRAASDLAKRAAAKDIVGSAKAFARMAEGCVNCHKPFRATLHPLSD